MRNLWLNRSSDVAEVVEHSMLAAPALDVGPIDAVNLHRIALIEICAHVRSHGLVVQLWMPVTDPVSHDPACPIEQPRAFQELFFRRHRPSASDLLRRRSFDKLANRFISA